MSLDFLRRVTLFRDLSGPDLEALAGQFRVRSARKGEVLLWEGDPGRGLFVIRKGRVTVSKGVVGRMEHVLARLGPGDFFGEMGLFDQGPCSATVQAETDAALLCMDRDHLRQFMDARPDAAAKVFSRLVQVFVARLRETDNTVAEVTRWGLEATGLDAAGQLPA